MDFLISGLGDMKIMNYKIRVTLHKITIDRSQFYPILDKNILMLTDGITRIINKDDFKQFQFKYKRRY